MKLFFIVFCIFFSSYCQAQKIIKAVWTNDTEIVTDVLQAKYLLIIKSYDDTAFERLDYNFAGPIVSRKMYSDNRLTILNGKYATYYPSGYLAEEGQYIQNKKDGSWYVFDDTSRAIKEMKYRLDSLVSVTDLDSLHKEKEKLNIEEDTTGQVEAYYKDGLAGIAKLISKKIVVPERTQVLTNGGTAKIRFVIDTTGAIINREVLKSVEFTFDEECMRVISLLKKWVPANDKGKLVKAYRIQPITVTF